MSNTLPYRTASATVTPLKPASLTSDRIAMLPGATAPPPPPRGPHAPTADHPLVHAPRTIVTALRRKARLHLFRVRARPAGGAKGAPGGVNPRPRAEGKWART